jgi:hypothetical protein
MLVAGRALLDRLLKLGRDFRPFPGVGDGRPQFLGDILGQRRGPERNPDRRWRQLVHERLNRRPRRFLLVRRRRRFVHDHVEPRIRPKPELGRVELLAALGLRT